MDRGRINTDAADFRSEKQTLSLFIRCIRTNPRPISYTRNQSDLTSNQR